MMFAEAIPTIKTPSPALLYSLATGDPGDSGYFPLAAVRWLTPPRDIAAMVTQRGSTRLEAELFHFGPKTRPMEAELYLLAPGRYAFRLVEDGSEASGKPTPFSVSGPRTRIAFELPPRKLCLLRVFRDT
jgi:hypothetical protein